MKIELAGLHRWMRGEEAERLGHRLDWVDLLILERLARSGDASLSLVAKAVSITTPPVSQRLHNMLAAGLVSVTKGTSEETGRIGDIWSTTPEGESALDAALGSMGA